MPKTKVAHQHQYREGYLREDMTRRQTGGQKRTLISAVARDTPIHLRGPAPHGAYPSGSFLQTGGLGVRGVQGGQLHSSQQNTLQVCQDEAGNECRPVEFKIAINFWELKIPVKWNLIVQTTAHMHDKHCGLVLPCWQEQLSCGMSVCCLSATD